MSFFERLPIELAIRIIATAVRVSVSDDPSSAFEAAIVCRATFTAAAPYLYSSLVIRRGSLRSYDHPNDYGAVLKHVRHMYISGESVDDDWAVLLLRAWWPPASTRAFLDAPLRVIQKTLLEIEPPTDCGVTGVRIVYGDLDGAFLTGGRLPVKWTAQLTHVIAYLPTLDNEFLTRLELWSEDIFAATPALVYLGLQVNDYDDYDDENGFVTGVEACVRSLLGRRKVTGNRDLFQLSQLCLRVSSAATTDVIESGLRNIVEVSNDSRFKIWIDARLNEVRSVGRRHWLQLDNHLDAEDVRRRWDFWTPGDRPDATVYWVSK